LAKIKKELSDVSGHSILADGVLQEMVQSGKVITKLKKNMYSLGEKIFITKFKNEKRITTNNRNTRSLPDND